MQPRERYACHGPGQFGNIELIALILGTGTAGETANQLGARLLARFDGLGGLGRAEPQQLMRVRGVGLARAVRVHAALQLGRRVLRDGNMEHKPIRSADDAVKLLEPAMRGLVDEELHGLFLDRRHHAFACRVLTHGSDSLTVVDPRQVYRLALSLNAKALILAHNHPSGDATPSAQDVDVTRRVAEAGKVVGIPLLDHLVVGAGWFSSLAERGELPHWSRASIA
ncbi:MAG: DNA repair protein RadC [Proteobacteria bacterium]|nr:DNA repair protein RadC [Pseudomonadota bacterium]